MVDDAGAGDDGTTMTRLLRGVTGAGGPLPSQPENSANATVDASTAEARILTARSPTVNPAPRKSANAAGHGSSLAKGTRST